MAFAREVVEASLASIMEGDSAARLAAVKALGRMGPAAVPAAAGPLLARLLEDADESVRMQAARALGKMGSCVGEPSTVEALVAHLLDPSEASVVRGAVAGALGSLGAPALGRQAVAALAQSCRSDPDQRVRSSAAGALGRLGGEAAGATAEALALCLTDGDMTVQIAAAGALARHRHHVVSALLGRLGSSEEEVRRQAAKALGCLGESLAPLVAEGLTRCALDSSAAVRLEALSSLHSLGLEAPPPSALARASSPTSSLQLPARALGHSPLPTTRKEEDGTESHARKRTREVSWAQGLMEPRGEGRLPVLLGRTPTPKGASEKPDFCMPAEKSSPALVPEAGEEAQGPFRRRALFA
eukprot:CAMPEP_0203968108 /NCGR_PEP_ID=MMETSP0359-20131031/96781_1 /ASSEMBLY_ACC=CAM_ASM_000338 /TAXON_ID=268821 /ORGANISM="Scrippsiella Hangoei, Strain SHTV-5" /LENGTH=356 /DNA_ID=CAMNT_0050906031 /DNA_START=68 /DNA_END=1138 /DNA_ORIENTATION=+